jgi:CubicO group peptidase (beta-lactamase class C family)
MKVTTVYPAIALPVFLSILLAQGCVSGLSESESAVYRSVVGIWTSSEDLDLPLEEMSLLSFSLDPNGRLLLSQYEADTQWRVWFGIDDFRVEDGFLKWHEFRAKVMPDSNTMRMDYFPPSGEPIPFTLRRLDRAEAFMTKLEASTAEGYNYKMPEVTGDGWQCVDAAGAGLDMEKIDGLMRDIIDGDYGDIHSVLVVKDGKLAVEEYFNDSGRLHSPFITELYRDRPHHQSSVAKSEISAIIGIALEQGYIRDLDVPIHEFFPEYAELFDTGKRKITLRHVLTMSSGLEWDESSHPHTDSRNSAFHWRTSEDRIRYYLERPLVDEPGTRFNYSGGCMMLLGEIVRRATGVTVEEFGAEHLFQPLGITRYKWLGEETLVTNHSGGLGLRPRDMAKIGLLFVDEGLWRGQQVISKEWTVESTKTRFDRKNTGYGYQWWTRRFEVDGKTYSCFYAIGGGGQFIFGFRDLDLVVVFTGANSGGRWSAYVYKMMEKYILPAVAAAES